LASPVSKEQFGRVVTEALACGRCVIVSDSGALPEIVGDAGIVVAQGDAEALASALQRAMGDEGLRASLGERGRVRAAGRFSTVRQADALEAVFSQWHRPERAALCASGV
jgi:glycosyltransferase involved in cell wall biosynthesis